MSEREGVDNRYRTLVESVADPMYWLAPDGTVEIVNDAMSRFVGVPRDELVGAKASVILDESDVDAIESLIADCIESADESSARYEFQLPDPSGEERWVEANLSPVVVDGEFRGSVGVVRDVTQRRRRETRLANFETIVETAPVGLFTLDEDAEITWANRVYAETLSMPRDELVGTSFPGLIARGYYDESVTEQYIDTVRDLLSSRTDTEMGRYVVETHVPDGETYIHEVFTALLPLEDGEFRGTVSAFRDVTTQKRYERELERQNDRLDEFASVVSHDLRNPLTIAEGYVDRTLETGDLDHLDRVQSAHERMRRLIDDLLTLAREEQTSREETQVDLGAVARSAWDSTETCGATLVIDSPGTARANELRLRQLFENLFRNSVEHGSTSSQRGSRADDSVEHGSTGSRPQADDSVEHGLGNRDDATDLVVTVGGIADGFFVADDGAGLDTDDPARVFDHGFTTAPDGTGLGLTIVETICDAHGWTIDATESDAGGARFEIRRVERS